MLEPLATMASASAIDAAIQNKMLGRGVRRVQKGIILVISNKDMDYLIRIIKSLEYSKILIDGVSETAKDGFLGMF